MTFALSRSDRLVFAIAAALCLVLPAALGIHHSHTSIRQGRRLTGAANDRATRTHRQLSPSTFQQTQVLQDENGGMPALPMFQDKDGDGIPDWIDFDNSNMDWTNIDWSQFSLQDFDWSNMDWTTDEWQTFLQSLVGGNDNIMTSAGASLPPMDICPILQAAVGIGQSFGMAGDCSCQGQLGSGLTIECGFQEECLAASLVCGSIHFNLTVDDQTGFIQTSVCLDTALDQYEEICFAYKLGTPLTASATLESSCEASYGGNPCKCEITDNLCLAMDCSAYLPGAQMDTCQVPSFDQAEDATSLIPRFPIFNDTFDGTFAFENINWTNLDWANVDWNNFGFDKVNWTTGMEDDAWASTLWGSLFPVDMPTAEICPILSSRVLGMSEEVQSAGCSCVGEQESGYNILCSFDQQCTPAAVVARSQGESVSTITESPMLCGNLALDLAFDNLGSINGDLCVDFDQDVHPITCIKYAIPVGANQQDSMPTCQATYGDQVCGCTIDENLCVQVDCSEYEATAVMDTCQVLTVEEMSDLQKLIPGFGIPLPPPVLEETGEIVVEEAKDQDSSSNVIATASELENSESSPASIRMVAISVAGVVVALALLPIVWW